MKKLLTLMVLSSALFSCVGNDSKSPSNTVNPSPTTPVATVSFSSVKNIVAQQCTTCHTSVGRTPSAGIAFDTDSSIVSRANRIKTRVSNKTMPPSTPLSAADIQLISDWVSQGAKI